MATKTGGRTAGSPNKRSQELLRQLEKDHNFSIVPKIVKLFGDTEKVYGPLMKKIEENINMNLAMDARLTEAELDLFNSCRKDLWVMLSKLLGYCYPKLKALEIQGGDTDKITFNINVPKASQGGDYQLQLEKVSLKTDSEEDE